MTRSAGGPLCEVAVPFDILLAHEPHDVLEDIDVRISASDGREFVLPAFQSGDGSVRARFAAPMEGEYRYVTSSGNPSFNGLHGAFDARPYEGVNPLYRHGRLRVGDGERTLEHVDGTPFLWLGDTWWMGLSPRLRWPGDYAALVADRVTKGFSVIQMVLGPACEFQPTNEGVWHPQQANEAGWPWDRGWSRINPSYYDRADDRIRYLVDAGVVPCIFGMWGFYLNLMGEDRVRRHWRNLVARYAAFPVVFCVAGEVNLPPYGSDDPEVRSSQRRRQMVFWGEMAHEVRRIDPFGNLVTAHPCYPDANSSLVDPSGLDINMLQTSHWSYTVPPESERHEFEDFLGLQQPIKLGFEGATAITRDAIARLPSMPVVNGEPCYEGIQGGNWQDVQRFMFWTGMLSGLAGFTYGAQGMWQMDSESEPFSNTRMHWGSGTWQEAMHYAGSRQVGLGRKFLEGFKWWDFQPLSSSIPGGAERVSPFASGTAGTMVYYLPSLMMDVRLRGMRGLPIDLGGRSCRATFVDPRTLKEFPISVVRPEHGELWRPPDAPSREDWLLVIQPA